MRQALSHEANPLNSLSKATLLPHLPPHEVPLSIAHDPAGLAHDARNMLAGMDIYCELLTMPGVLQPHHLHLAEELRLLRINSAGLLDRLLLQVLGPKHTSLAGNSVSPGHDELPIPGPTENHSGPIVTRERKHAFEETEPGTEPGTEPMQCVPVKMTPEAPAWSFGAVDRVDRDEFSPRKRVTCIASELRSCHGMLSALAGPRVQVLVESENAPEGELLIGSSDFTRVLINLVRNAAEAMGTGGRIVICAKRAGLECGQAESAMVSVEDNGPGIPLNLLDRIFELSSETSASSEHARRRMSFRPRGLGLRIVRELVEGGGGVIRAARLPERGSRFEIVLPMVTTFRGVP